MARTATRTTLIAALVGMALALAVVVAPKPASAEGLWVTAGYVELGDGWFYLGDTCELESETSCPDGLMATGFGWLPIDVTFDVDLFTHDTHLAISDLTLHLTSVGTCAIVIDGPFLLDSTTGDDYELIGTVGSYTTTGSCTLQAQGFIHSWLGASPSTADIVLTFTIEML